MKLGKIIFTIYHHDKILHEHPQIKRNHIQQTQTIGFHFKSEVFTPSNKME